MSRIPPRTAKAFSTWKQSSPVAQRLFASLIRGVSRGPMRIQHGPAAGLRLQLAGTSIGTVLGINEPEVVEALSSAVRPGDTLYDLGANVGYMTLVAARLVGSGGRVCAFEPIPETAAVLRENVALNGLDHVSVHEIAVSDRAGRARFDVADASVRARAAAGHSESRTVEVELASLDDLIASGIVPPPDFIKMDIEGAEVAALEGLRGTLQTRRPGLLIEVHGTQVAVVDFLRAAGYSVAGVEADVPAEEVPDFTHVIAIPQPAPAGRGPGRVSVETESTR